MDGQGTARSLVCAIPSVAVFSWLVTRLMSLGRELLAAGASQGRCIEAIAERTGARIGPEKLRNITAHLADTMEPQRQACQVQQLEQWIDEAVKQGVNVTFAVSRDGVSLGIAPFGNFEMASVASLSVIADGKRIGTVYLARAPEENQETLDPRRGSTHPDPPLHPAQPNLDGHIP